MGAAFERPIFRWSRRGGWIAVALLAHLPLLLLAAESLLSKGKLSLENYGALLTPRVFSLAGRSLLLAVIGTAIASAAGMALAVAIEMRPVPLRRAWRLAALAPLLLPPYMQVAAWRPVLLNWTGGSEAGNSIAAALVLGLSHAPWMFYFASQGIRGISGDILDAARLSVRGERPVIFRIVLPLAAPAAAVGAALVFLFILLDPETPSLLFVPALATEVFSRVAHGPGAAFAAASPALAAVLFLVSAADGWSRRRGFAVTSGENLRAPHPPGASGIGAVALASSFAAIAVLFPLIRLLSMAGWGRRAGEAWVLHGASVLDTIPVTAGAAFLATLLAFVCAPRSGRPSRWTSAWAWAALAAPGTLLGAAFLRVWNLPGLDGIYESRWILVLAGAARFFPIAYCALSAHLRTVPRELWEAADLAPISSWERLRRVSLPLSAPGLVLAASAVAILQAGDVAAAVLLAPPGHRPLAVEISSALHYSVDLEIPAALCLFQIASTLAVAGGIRLAGKMAFPRAGRLDYDPR